MFKCFKAILLTIITVLLFSSVLINTGCRSKYEKLKRSPNVALKYTKAKEYYNKKDYFRALPLFEELVNVYRGSNDAEDIYYYYAYCNYGLKDLVAARYHFKVFAETYPKSTRAEECRYMSAFCYYQESPYFSLDQTNTYRGIEALQLFINLYPKSERVSQCNTLIDILRAKLESKSFYNAKTYYNIGEHKSAIIAFRNSIKDFPDSKFREEIEFLIIKSSYLYAENSVDSKKEERYLATIAAYQLFVDAYKNSPFQKEASGIYDNALKKLDRYKNITLNNN